MGSFWGVGKLWFCGWRRDFRGAAGWAFELDAVSVVPKAVDGCRGEQPIIGKGLVPLGEVQI